ncbi:MAG: IS4 family transposase [Pseudomonadota bacterium]|jgi:Transposase DDE domain
MDASQIISLIPESLLRELAIETGVNRYSKKLRAEIVFKLLMHCILSHKDNSLRTMESAYESIVFKLLNNSIKKKQQVRFSSISERLSVMKAAYFEKLFYAVIGIYGEEIKEKETTLIRFDSTIVALSSQLLKVGYHLKGGDADHVRQLKFTIGFSELPMSADFYTAQKYNSENAALKISILAQQPDKENTIRIFDRGITSRKTYDEFIDKKIPFISRLNNNSKLKTVTENQLQHPIQTATLLVDTDQWVYLYSEGSVKAKHPVRYIRGNNLISNEPITFVTNISDIDAAQITELYKRRWDIEVFFKFLKQELNFSHLINRSENGIRIMLYATMIAAILLLVYKKKNRLSGYKIMKQKFVQELEKSITRDIVIMTGGNPILFDKLFGKPPN